MLYMDQIILNTTSLRKGNNQFKNIYDYQFPNNINFKDGDSIGLASLSMYNSFFNIRSALGNNTFSYVWNAATPTTHNITLDDGFYDIASLNYKIQYEMILNDHYMIDSAGDYVYYIELVLNSVVNGTRFNFTPIPNSSEATALSYTQPSGSSWVLPTVKKCAEIIISSSFGVLFGFESGTYPSVTSDFIVVKNTLSGEIQQVNSIFLTCNLVNSPISNPPNIIGAIPLKSSFGSLIQYESSERVHQKIFPGNYKNLTITLYDQSMNPLVINDTEGFVLTLVVDWVKRE